MLPQFILQSLIKNNTVQIPASSDMAQLAHEPYDKLLLAGIPAESLTHGMASRGKKLEVTMATLVMESLSLEHASPTIARGPYERIYGQIGPDVKKHVHSIEGMSGGPVFGLWYSEDGSQFRYIVVGVQSGWDSGERQIAAWPIEYLIHYFNEVSGGWLGSR